MPNASISLDVDVGGALEALENEQTNIKVGGEDAVQQLAILAERHMKAEAPEGAGIPDVHMRSTIRPEFSDDGRVAEIKPHKRTDEGWLLHKAIVGNPSTPTFDSGSKPPVWSEGGEAQGPLAEWADAKLNDRNAAWAVRESIAESGHSSFPNKFIDRSVGKWRSSVNRIADRAISDALGSGRS